MSAYWITKDEFDTCDMVLYRAYIFNFQEDMWGYIYPALVWDEFEGVSRRFYKILTENKTRFLDYVTNPTNPKILDHCDWINTELLWARDKLKEKESNPDFPAAFFLQAVNRLLEEFGE